MKRRGVLLPIVVFLILGIAAVFPLLVSMSETTLKRTQYSEEWARIQWAIEGANQKQIESSPVNVATYSGVVTTIATFTYPESGGSFDVAVAISEGRTMLGRHRNLTATAKAYRNGVDAGYDLSGLTAATVSVPGVAAGGEHSFAWKKDGTLYSWGRYDSGQLGRLSDIHINHSAPNKTETGACLSSSPPYYTQGWMVAGGGSHTLALDYYGGVYSWGRNNRGQLGHSGTTNVNVPQTVVVVGGAHLQNVSDLAAGDEFSLALTTSGNIRSWGDDLRGQLGYDPEITYFLGIPVSEPSPYVGLPQFVVGLDGRGTVLQNIVGISAGARHALAIDFAGNVFGWGDNTYNQLGGGFTGAYRRKPIMVNDTVATGVAQIEYTANQKAPPKATDFGIAVSHFIGSFTIEINDNSYRSNYGLFFNYDCLVLTHADGTSSEVRFTRVRNLTGGRYEWAYDKRDTSTSYSLVKPGSYTVTIVNRHWLWGSGSLSADWYKNNSSDLSKKDKGVFNFHGRPVEEPTAFFGIAAGGDFSMAVRVDGTATRLYTWGRNNAGQLGHGDNTQRNRMAPIPNFPPSGERIRTIAAGREHALALTESGKVYSWGRNNNGQLGSNNTTDRWSPAQITHTIGSIKINGIVAGAYHSLAIDEEGRVYGWGLQSNGRVGNGSTSGNRTTPVQLTGFP